MNRKNTILIAVMINAGLLAVLLIAALTSQDEVTDPAPTLAEAPLSLPPFDDSPLFHEVASLSNDAMKASALEIPVVEAVDPLIHKLPALAASAPEPAAPPVVAAAPVPAPAPVPVAVAPAPVSAPAPVGEVKVKKGDTLEKIAKAHHTTVSEIIKINHLPSSFLKIGQVLKIPVERSLPKVAAEKKPVEFSPEYYTMKVGENPWAIAMKHHMKVEELLRLNGLNEEKARKLKAGDRLRIR